MPELVQWIWHCLKIGPNSHSSMDYDHYSHEHEDLEGMNLSFSTYELFVLRHQTQTGPQLLGLLGRHKLPIHGSVRIHGPTSKRSAISWENVWIYLDMSGYVWILCDCIIIYNGVSICLDILGFQVIVSYLLLISICAVFGDVLLSTVPLQPCHWNHLMLNHGHVKPQGFWSKK